MTKTEMAHSLRQLNAFLREYPKVIRKHPDEGEAALWFVGMAATSFRFRREDGSLCYSPLGRLVGHTGVEFHDRGFIASELGVAVRYEYLAGEVTRFELVYGKGGHGGPYIGYAAAYEAAKRLLAGSATEHAVHVVPRSAPFYDRKFAVAHIERSEL